jgi:hypothetical protein
MARVAILSAWLALLAWVWPARGAEARTAATEAADGAGTRFEYVRAPGAEACPDREAVRAGVAAHLGYDPFSDGGGRTLRCAITRDGAGLRAQIDVTDARGAAVGTRTLTSPRADCRDLATAALLAISLAARRPQPAADATAADTATPATGGAAPAAAANAASAASATPAAPAADTTVTASAVASSPPPRRPGAPLGFHAGVGTAATLGSVPGVSWAGAVQAGVDGGAASLSIEARLEAPQAEAVGAGRVSLWMAAATLLACWRPGHLSLCGVAGGGIVRGAGEDLPGARRGVGPWIGAGGRVAWLFPLGPASALQAHAELLGVPLRTRLRVGDAAVWTTPPLSGALGLSWVYRFR